MQFTRVDVIAMWFGRLGCRLSRLCYINTRRLVLKKTVYATLSFHVVWWGPVMSGFGVVR